MIYFTFNKEKIYIEFMDNNIIFKKEVNGNLIKLSDFEEKELLDKLKPKDPFILYSVRIESIVKNNKTLNSNYDYFLPFLTFIEGLIPENYKESFYKNLENINVDLNLEGKELENGKDSLGYYDSELNKIIINSKKIKDCLKLNNCLSDDTFWKVFNKTLIHELFHVASTHCNKDENIVVSGFDKRPSKKLNDSNIGLNEGFTEVLSYAAVPDAPDFIYGYIFETLFASQLSFILGPEVMIESYFGNRGIDLLTEKLCEIKNDKSKAISLFTLIDLNYFITDDGEQTLLGTIQSKLVEYFKLKILNDIKNGVTEEEINLSINSFKNVLITNNLIISRGKNPSDYPNLHESIEAFSNLEKEIKEMASVELK